MSNMSNYTKQQWWIGGCRW